MNAKLLILTLIFAYLIIQNFLSVYVLNISFDFQLRKLSLNHYRRVQKKLQLKFSHRSPSQQWKEYANYTILNTTPPRTPPNKSDVARVAAINHDVHHKRKNATKLPQQQPFPPPSEPIYGKSYHYQHMKKFARMTGLHDKLKSRFNQNLNLSFPFHYLIKNEALCWPNLYLVNLLLSAPHDFKTRSAIRGTWGSTLWKKATRYQIVHLLGNSEDEKINGQVLNENKRHGDIVQVDFKDSYHNLSLKVLSGLHWTTEFCSNVKWVMKSDSDVFVNIFKLVSFLEYYTKKAANPHSNILCKPKPANELFPLRNHTKHKKWNVDREEYPFDNYPPSCYGPAYIIPRRLIPKLYAASDKRHPFVMEDVYYTGIIPQLLDEDVNILDIGPLFPWRPKSLPKDPSKSLMIFEFKRYHPNQSISKLWKKMLSLFKLKRNDKQRTNKM